MRKNIKLGLNKKSKKKVLRQKKLTSIQFGRQLWSSRRAKYSLYPYLVTVSLFRKNVFVNVSDFKGRTKLWTNAGRLGFGGRVKVEHLTVVKILDDFMQEIWRKGIRCVLLKFNNRGGKRRYSLKTGIKRSLEKYNVRFIGLITTIGVTFNGCRRKKKRRN